MNKQFEFYKHLITSDLNFALSKLDLSKFPQTDISLWDLVIITAINYKQKSCYEHQIKTKLAKRKLPNLFKYLVLNDPDACKIGSGGSTLNVIRHLYETYTNHDLSRMKILLIHAGGYSQRMPFNTVLGKIFAPVPCESEYINDFLDIKLAIYTPFSILMQPGIFVSSSDDIISCSIDEQIEAGSFFGSDNKSFALLSHKSSLETGKDHGIYAIGQKISKSVSFGIYDCYSVLQKPSIDKMRAKKFVLLDESGLEYVQSDSAFYFSHTITQILADLQKAFLTRIIAEKIELDAYRDFLQPLGTNSTTIEEYLVTSKANPCQHDIFKSIFNFLTDQESIVLALTNSEFFHLGTVNEIMSFYFDLTSTEAFNFRHSVCFKKLKFKFEGKHKKNITNGCVYYTTIKGDCCQKEGSLMEFCYIGEDILIEQEKNSYINNCSLKACELIGKWDTSEPLKVPESTCFHTMCIKIGDKTKFVTVFFGRNDDLKKLYESVADIEFLGRRMLEGVLVIPEINSVWGLRIFQASDTMSESFVRAIQFVEEYLSGDVKGLCKKIINEQKDVYCFFDLLDLQSHEEMIKFREGNFLI